jgi:iron complex transport system permease protein
VRRLNVSSLAVSLLTPALFALLSVVLAMWVGEQPLSLEKLLAGDALTRTIFYSLRLPRVALGFLVGAALSVSGNALQMLFRNPLADPFVLGVSGGAALGATLTLWLNLASLGAFVALSSSAVGALLGAVAATLVVFALAAGRPGSSTVLLLVGVIVNTTSLAAITFIRSLAGPEKLGEVLYWLSGVLGYESWQALTATGVVIFACVVLLSALSPQLNVLTLGDDDARSLGLDVRRIRALVLAASTVAIAAAVSLSGLIGFVGLLVPHLTRRLWGHDARISVPSSALLGGSLLVLADLGARLLFGWLGSEPPVGVLTAVLGGPLFLVLLARKRGESPQQ